MLLRCNSAAVFGHTPVGWSEKRKTSSSAGQLEDLRKAFSPRQSKLKAKSMKKVHLIELSMAAYSQIYCISMYEQVQQSSVSQLHVIFRPEFVPSFVEGAEDCTSYHSLLGRGIGWNLLRLVTEGEPLTGSKERLTLSGWHLPMPFM